MKAEVRPVPGAGQARSAPSHGVPGQDVLSSFSQPEAERIHGSRHEGAAQGSRRFSPSCRAPSLPSGVRSGEALPLPSAESSSLSPSRAQQGWFFAARRGAFPESCWEPQRKFPLPGISLGLLARSPSGPSELPVPGRPLQGAASGTNQLPLAAPSSQGPILPFNLLRNQPCSGSGGTLPLPGGVSPVFDKDSLGRCAAPSPASHRGCCSCLSTWSFPTAALRKCPSVGHLIVLVFFLLCIYMVF